MKFAAGGVRPPIKDTFLQAHFSADVGGVSTNWTAFSFYRYIVIWTVNVGTGHKVAFRYTILTETHFAGFSGGNPRRFFFIEFIFIKTFSCS